MEMPKIRVANFEGPFDLVLHLIKKNEMDIYNIEIYKITNQYLRYLDDMKTMDLDITSEFVVVAATLIEIKSKKLLPIIKKNEDEESEEDEEKKLMEKLIEYRKIKNASIYLREKYLNSGEIYTKKPEIIEDISNDNKDIDLFKNTTLIDLYNLYNKLIENFFAKQNKENVIQRKVYVDKYKIEDKINKILNIIKGNDIINFVDIINEDECKLESVVTFLALLELIKLRRVKVYQDNNFDEILVQRRMESE